MTFAKLINVLNLLEHDKDIMVVKKSVTEDDYDDYDRVTSFSKYDEIGDYMEYITDVDNDYEFLLWILMDSGIRKLQMKVWRIKMTSSLV
jgi:hypothetical protein